MTIIFYFYFFHFTFISPCEFLGNEIHRDTGWILAGLKGNFKKTELFSWELWKKNEVGWFLFRKNRTWCLFNPKKQSWCFLLYGIKCHLQKNAKHKKPCPVKKAKSELVLFISDQQNCGLLVFNRKCSRDRFSRVSCTKEGRKKKKYQSSNVRITQVIW